MKSIVFDTNSYSLLTQGDKKIMRLIENVDIVYFSAIVLGELFGGFEQGTRIDKNLTELQRALTDPKVKALSVTRKTAQIYGKVRAILRKKGKPIPTNDIWIAAQTIETDSTLITHDGHFLEIPNLKVWDQLAK
jgi:tRNA(fMet)-specific endonuclease VapC